MEAGINIRALSLADTTDFGILRLIVNRPDEAFQILKQRDYAVAIVKVRAITTDQSLMSFLV